MAHPRALGSLGLSALCATLALACADEGGAVEDNCFACRHDGEACRYSINCPSFSLCNWAGDDRYDPRAREGICVHVVCEDDASCEAPKVCTPERVCRAPICQGDGDCTGGTLCFGGACAPRPSAAEAERCAIVTPARTVLVGATLPLDALVFDAKGAVIPRAELTWRSSHPAALTITASTAMAVQVGRAALSASVRDRPSVVCPGPTLSVLDPVPAGRTRVVAVDLRTGEPIEGAEVTIAVGEVHVRSTDALGRVELALTSTVESVTVVKVGWHVVSVLAPGTRDLFVPVPAIEDLTRSAGIRGSVDLTKAPHDDVPVGLVYGARSPELLDYRAVPGADLITSVVHAPELGVDDEAVDLPGNVLLGIGAKRFTADAARCRGDVPEPGALGCFLVHARPGPSAAWVLGGEVHLSLITGLSAGFSPEVTGVLTSKDRARLALFLSPLVRSLWLGVAPLVQVTSAPRVPRDPASGVDCADPAIALTTACRSDLDRYARADLTLEAPLRALESTVTSPPLPELPLGGCAGSVVMSDYAVLPGRGLVLVGIGMGRDVAQDEAPDCALARDRSPFGFFSQATAPGELALHSAPLLAGLEDSRRIIVLAAVDTGPGETRPRDLNLRVEPVDHLGPRLDLSARPFLRYPRGRLDRAAGTFTVEAVQRDTRGDEVRSGRRLSLDTARGSWIVYAPPTMTTLALPDVAAARGLVAEVHTGVLQSFALDAPFEALWSLGGAARADQTIEHLRAIATTQCGARGPCLLP